MIAWCVQLSAYTSSLFEASLKCGGPGPGIWRSDQVSPTMPQNPAAQQVGTASFVAVELWRCLSTPGNIDPTKVIEFERIRCEFQVLKLALSGWDGVTHCSPICCRFVSTHILHHWATRSCQTGRGPVSEDAWRLSVISE